MDPILLFVTFLSFRVLTTKSALSILAPEIICPEGDNNMLERPDYFIIRILSDSHADMNIKWSVSWSPLTVVTQRHTIMVWKSVRDLEKKLNEPQAEPLLFVIKNDELICGVNYILNLTASAPDEVVTKSFSIKYNKENLDATMSSNDAFSMILLGGRVTYADIEFIIEADITTCSSTQDYYNAGQSELAGLFTRTLLESLPGLHSACSLPQYRYAGILGQLAAAGFDVTPLLA